MKNTIRTGCAGLLISLVAVATAGAADVTVRAEGPASTTVAQVTVSNTGPNALASGKSCPAPIATGNTAAGALERAVSGDWDGSSFSFGLTVDRIRAVSLPFSGGSYWNFDVNNVSQQVGVCDVNPQAGDELLFYAACASVGATNCFTGNPLDVKAPATVQAGSAFTVQVDQYNDSVSPPVKTPGAGATVAGGGATATANASGVASVTLNTPGTVTLTATKGTQVRDSAPVVVTAAPVAIYELPIPTSTTTPEPTVTADTRPPESRITSIAEGRRFKKRKGPRTIKATVAEDGGLASVRLSLVRRKDDRCTVFNVGKDRFAKVRCGRHPLFNIGTSPDVSVLLPAKLGTGRYVLDVIGIDKAGNVESLARGRNRVVFTVR